MPVDTRVILTQSLFDNHIQSIRNVLVQNVKTASDIRQLQKELEDVVQKITQLKLFLMINKIVQQLILILDVAFSGFFACYPEFTQEQVAVFLQRCIDRALDVRENPNALLTNYIIIIPDPVAAVPEPVVAPEPAMTPQETVVATVPVASPEPAMAPQETVIAATVPVAVTVPASQETQTKKLVLKF